MHEMMSSTIAITSLVPFRAECRSFLLPDNGSREDPRHSIYQKVWPYSHCSGGFRPHHGAHAAKALPVLVTRSRSVVGPDPGPLPQLLLISSQVLTILSPSTSCAPPSRPCLLPAPHSDPSRLSSGL